MARPVSNPHNPWHTLDVHYLEDPPEAKLEVYEEEARSILSENESPDVPFRWSLNPYRGCFHGCSYCYARPSHQYLDWGAGTDFDRRLVVKLNAAELLRRRFESRSWGGERVAFSGNTDCYQPLEASYRITRACLEVCAEYRNPVAIVTKGALVHRDLDLLARLRDEASVTVALSIPFADDAVGRVIEPNASSIRRRFETLAALAEAGIDVGVAVAPVIPGLNDVDVPQVLARAREAGARYAFRIPLRLPLEVKNVFLERLRECLPLRAARVLSAIKEMRDGGLNEARFGARMDGRGPRWQVIDQLFESECRRLGLDLESERPAAATFRRPEAQGSLFEPA